MPLTSHLRHFQPGEFKHPELINDRAAVCLDEWRDRFGEPVTVTDDARPAGDIPPGGSNTSLHFKGKAFDLRSRDWTLQQMWKAAAAAISLVNFLMPGEGGIELELVSSSTDKHMHLGFFLDGRANRLIVRGE